MRYCSKRCAEEDWKWHKDFCRKKQEKKEKRRRKEAGEKQEEEECFAMVAALKLN